ncbi:HI0074 family nucleotidyltransferase substrate-binding subunit [Duganella hordei]|uniref:HI0074 family nucleotidyltransferase substrate-binding subunit n=1 Tax=Duganella hordei TaxID=2865934 RepID=UPI0030E8BD2A
MSKCLAERVNDFLTAMTRLEEALAQPEDSFMRDATIQRFEFTYELAWRSLKLWLETKDISALNAKDTLQAALEQGLLVDGNGLSQLHRMRNLASHAYDETQARQVYRFIKNDGFQLLRVLADQTLRQRTSGIGASA